MLDPELFSDAKLKQTKEILVKRGVAAAVIDEVAHLGVERRKLIHETEELKSKRNAASKEIGILKGKSKTDPEAGKRADEKMKETKHLGDEISGLEEKLRTLEDGFSLKTLTLPNIPHSSVPTGDSAENNIEVRKWGAPKTFDFKAKDHVELGEALGIIDFERAAKLSGARFYILRGAGASLERALAQFMLDEHIGKNGYQEMLTPFMVNREAMTGTGQLPKFEQDLFKTSVAERELFLIPTAEVSLTNIYAGEILDEKDLPMNLTAFSPCFRSEAGSYGKDTRGMIRVHQFNKVELVKLAHPSTSFEELEKMTGHAEGILKALELPYRVMALCTGDMGFSATKTYDLEVWLPSQAAYREISSCSNCGDFQARRAKIRFRSKETGNPQLVHTLNGSGLAVGRTFLAVLENFQTKDGRVKVPQVLHRYLEFANGFTRQGPDLFLNR